MRSEARQRQILACAKRVFAERGFHAANVSHICAAAGIGRGTLYLYFANKRAVLTAILAEVLGRVRSRMEQQASRTTFAPVQTVSRAQAIAFSARQLRDILAVVFEDEATLRIVLREAVGLDVDIEHLLGQIDAALIAIVERGLRDARAAGYLRELDAPIVATMIVGGVEKLALGALRARDAAGADGSPVDLDALCLEAARLHAVGTLSDNLRSE